MGGWDSHNIPTLEPPRLGLRAEFWVNGSGNDALSPTGIYLQITTDQVRFYRAGGTEPISLQEITPIVFTEVMRDVDLFVGVCSAGNDPNWHDGGDAGFGEYWQRISFGELSETAHTRQDVLARLLPRLKIANRASLEGRFLVVRGDLRTYKIHLGSGNILMAPNDQYLCIVPGARRGNQDMFLPFEGDTLLSIILSKAFLLADDTKIKDPTIVAQINRQ
jgi:hypothetical protein